MASTTSDTGDTSSKQQQAQRKEKYNKSKRPVSSVEHCHPYTRKKEKRNSLLNLHMLQSTCFGTKIETGVDSKDDSGSQGQYREERREVRGKMTLTVEYSEMTATNVEHIKISATTSANCVCVTMKRKCQTNGKPDDKRYRRYFKYYGSSKHSTKKYN